jgi:hypothetical protein
VFFGCKRYRRSIIHSGQPENDMSFVVLFVWWEATHGFEGVIEKFCHWWLGRTFYCKTLCMITHLSAEANISPGRCKAIGDIGGLVALVVAFRSR